MDMFSFNRPDSHTAVWHFEPFTRYLCLRQRSSHSSQVLSLSRCPPETSVHFYNVLPIPMTRLVYSNPLPGPNRFSSQSSLFLMMNRISKGYPLLRRAALNLKRWGFRPELGSPITSMFQALQTCAADLFICSIRTHDQRVYQLVDGWSTPEGLLWLLFYQ
jgi:hypothetical protein